MRTLLVTCTLLTLFTTSCAVKESCTVESDRENVKAKAPAGVRPTPDTDIRRGAKGFYQR